MLIFSCRIKNGRLYSFQMEVLVAIGVSVFTPHHILQWEVKGSGGHNVCIYFVRVVVQSIICCGGANETPGGFAYPQ